MIAKRCLESDYLVDPQRAGKLALKRCLMMTPFDDDVDKVSHIPFARNAV